MILHNFIIEQFDLSVVLLDLSLDLAVQALELFESALPARAFLAVVHVFIAAVRLSYIIIAQVHVMSESRWYDDCSIFAYMIK